MAEFYLKAITPKAFYFISISYVQSPKSYTCMQYQCWKGMHLITSTALRYALNENKLRAEFILKKNQDGRI